MSQPTQLSQPKCTVSKDNVDISSLVRSPDGGIHTCITLPLKHNDLTSVCFKSEEFQKGIQTGKIQIFCKDGMSDLGKTRVCSFQEEACNAAPFQ